MRGVGGVLCTGNLVVDILVRPVEAILWGATVQVESIEQHSGGNGANTAYTLGKLGARVRLLGMVGSDPFGDFVLEKMRGAGVDTSGLRRSEASTATTVVLVNPAGARGFLHRLGSSSEMSIT